MAADSPRPTETIHAAGINAGLLANPASEPGIARRAPDGPRHRQRGFPAAAGNGYPSYCRQYAGAQSGYRVTIVPL